MLSKPAMKSQQFWHEQQSLVAVRVGGDIKEMHQQGQSKCLLLLHPGASVPSPQSSVSEVLQQLLENVPECSI